MKRSYLLFIGLLVLSIFGCAYFNTYYNAKRYYNKAYHETVRNRTGKPSSKEKTNYGKAIEKSLKLIQYYPKSKYVDDALFILGKSYFYTQEYHKARRKFLELKVNYPESKFTLDNQLWLARSDLEMEQFFDAEQTLNNLLTQNVSSKMTGEIYYYLGKLNEKRKKYDEAVTAYELAAVSGVKKIRIEALFSMAANYDSMGVYDKAAESFQAVIKAKPATEIMFDAQFRYAQMKKKQKQYNEAIQLFERMVGEEKNSKWIPELSLEIAECLKLMRDINGAVIAYQDIIQDNKRTEHSAKSYYLLGKIFEEEKRDYDRAWEQFDLVGKEYPKSVYTDSARTKKRDILRLQALQQVIEMAITGSEDDLVTVENEEVERDTLWNGDLDLKTEITEEDSLQIDDQNGLVDETGDLEVEVDRDKPGDLETPGIEERVKPVENPELKTFKKEELDKNLLLLGELYLFRFLLPDSAVLKYRYLVNQLPQSKYADQALYSLGFISMEIHKDPAGADTSFKMLVQNYPQSKFSNPARQHIDLPLLNTKEDSVKILFEEAEYFLFEKDDPWTSFNKLNIIWQKYPNSVLAPKAIYTMAWIGENRLDSLNLSFALYDTLIHQYPKTEYAKKVKKKVDYVIAEKQKAIDDKEKRENENLQELNAKEQEVQIKDKDKEEIREKSERDEEESSVRRIEKTEESDSIQALPVGGISAITKQLAKAGILKKHPFSGVVIVEVYVDAKGKVTKTEFEQSSNIKEVDQAVANIIRGIQFQPAKKGGKSVLSTTVLTIPIGVLE